MNQFMTKLINMNQLSFATAYEAVSSHNYSFTEIKLQ